MGRTHRLPDGDSRGNPRTSDRQERGKAEETATARVRVLPHGLGMVVVVRQDRR